MFDREFPFDYNWSDVQSSFHMAAWRVRFDWAWPSAAQWQAMAADAARTHALTAAVAYIVLIALVRATLGDGRHYQAHKRGWKLVMALHNAALAVYSLGTFVLALRSLSRGRGPFTADAHDVFAAADWPRLAQLFWLSKYWEYLDTLFLVVMGKPVTLLQSYHHFGAGLVMWALYYYRNPEIWIFVLFNSFIHTLMYTYYTGTVLKFNLSAFKPIMTLLQILQLVIGGCTLSLWSPMNQENYRTSHTLIGSLVFSQAYIVILLGLFLQFFAQSYIFKPKRANKKKTN